MMWKKLGNCWTGIRAAPCLGSRLFESVVGTLEVSWLAVSAILLLGVEITKVTTDSNGPADSAQLR